MRNYFSHIEKKYCGAAVRIFAMRNHSFGCENHAYPAAPAACAIQSPLSITWRPAMRVGWIS